MNKKFYLNDLMKDYFFDVNDLSELWYHNDEGWFTYDEHQDIEKAIIYIKQLIKYIEEFS